MAGAAATAERRRCRRTWRCGRSAPAPAGFDPRRDAVARVYRYRIRMAGERRARSIGIGRSRSTTGSTSPRCAPRRRALLGERDFAALGSDTHGVERFGTCRGGGRAARRPRRDPRHGERVPAADGAQHRGAPARGRARRQLAPAAVAGLLDAPATGARRAGGAGARADPRAGHLFEYERIASARRRIGPSRGEEEQNREDLRSQGERDRARAGGWSTPPTRRSAVSRRASPPCSRASTSPSTRRTSTPAITSWSSTPRGSGDRQQAARRRRYYRHSNYPGGLKEESLAGAPGAQAGARDRAGGEGDAAPEPARSRMFKKLKVYGGAEHPHQAQQPTPLEL